jgi:hypothetical protein
MSKSGHLAIAVAALTAATAFASDRSNPKAYLESLSGGYSM